IEPEQRQRRQHAALVRDGSRQHPVEGADAIGGDNDETIAEIVDVADLAATAGIAGHVATQEVRHESILLPFPESASGGILSSALSLSPSRSVVGRLGTTATPRKLAAPAVNKTRSQRLFLPEK